MGGQSVFVLGGCAFGGGFKKDTKRKTTGPLKKDRGKGIPVIP